MQTPPTRSWILLSLTSLLLTIGAAAADQTVNTGIPGGDGKELLTNPRDPDQNGGAIVVRDEECAKKTMKGPRLNNGQPNPAYEKCVKDKLEKAKKKGEH